MHYMTELREILIFSSFYFKVLSTCIYIIQFLHLSTLYLYFSTHIYLHSSILPISSYHLSFFILFITFQIYYNWF